MADEAYLNNFIKEGQIGDQSKLLEPHKKPSSYIVSQPTKKMVQYTIGVQPHSTPFPLVAKRLHKSNVTVTNPDHFTAEDINSHCASRMGMKSK